MWFLPSRIHLQSEICICDNYFSLGFSQFNNIANLAGNVLDLCFSNTSNVQLLPCDPLCKIDVNHPTFSISMNIEGDDIVSKKVDWYFDFAHADYTWL